MGESYVNPHDHAVRVGEHRQRVAPGGVVELDNANDAKSVGLKRASKEDQDRYGRELAAASGPEGEGARSTRFNDSIVQARLVPRVQGTVVPLQEVIGDDAAPYGPPTGTLTTKMAVAREGDVNRRAFADHERFPEEADSENLPEIEREQAENKGRVEEVIGEVGAAASENAADEPRTAHG